MQQSFFVGIDVGGTRLRLIVQDTGTGTRSAPVEVPVPRSVEAMVDTVETLARAAAGTAPIASVAMGLPGQVLDRRCVWVPNLRFLDGVALGDLVAERLGVPCRLLNDAQATLVAEAAEGTARGFDDVVLVAVGTGIGGAYQVGGRLVRGANGCAGAFGWLPFAGPGRDPDPDPDHGQWEQAGSGRSLERLALPWGTTEALLAAARRGDADARTVVDGYAAVLGAGVAALASVLDPEIVVFGGGLVSAFDLLGGPMTAAVRAHASPAGGGVRLRPAALGNAAGVVGALRWAAERPGAPVDQREVAR